MKYKLTGGGGGLIHVIRFQSEQAFKRTMEINLLNLTRFQFRF